MIFFKCSCDTRGETTSIESVQRGENNMSSILLEFGREATRQASYNSWQLQEEMIREQDRVMPLSQSKPWRAAWGSSEKSVGNPECQKKHAQGLGQPPNTEQKGGRGKL